MISLDNALYYLLYVFRFLIRDKELYNALLPFIRKIEIIERYTYNIFIIKHIDNSISTIEKDKYLNKLNLWDNPPIPQS